MTDATSSKACTRCDGDPQPLDNFYVQRSTKDGRTSACRSCIKAQVREGQYLHRYGLLPVEMDAMRAMQGEACAICRRPFTDHGKARTPNVDHCHRSDIVRGLLCLNCNTGLGSFEDNEAWLRNAIEYLTRPPFTLIGVDPSPCAPKTELGRRRLKEYGINEWQLEQLLLIQDNSCAVCLVPFNEGSKVCVDHDHRTKAIRGLLCNTHNLGISRLGDTVERLETAIAYLADPPAHGQIRLMPRDARPCRQDVRASKRVDGASKFVGVSWDKRNRRWIASASAEGRRFHLGRFEDERQAAAAVDAKLRELGRVRVNFPREGELPASEGAAESPPSLTEAPRKGRRPNRNNRSGFKGVSLQANGRFQAWIVHEKVRYHLGTFRTAEEAARAWNAKAVELRGPDCWLNPVAAELPQPSDP